MRLPRHEHPWFKSNQPQAQAMKYHRQHGGVLAAGVGLGGDGSFQFTTFSDAAALCKYVSLNAEKVAVYELIYGRAHEQTLKHDSKPTQPARVVIDIDHRVPMSEKDNIRWDDVVAEVKRALCAVLCAAVGEEREFTIYRMDASRDDGDAYKFSTHFVCASVTVEHYDADGRNVMLHVKNQLAKESLARKSIDMTIYSNNRQMRVCGSYKNKGDSTPLTLVGDTAVQHSKLLIRTYDELETEDRVHLSDVPIPEGMDDVTITHSTSWTLGQPVDVNNPYLKSIQTWVSSDDTSSKLGWSGGTISDARYGDDKKTRIIVKLKLPRGVKRSCPSGYKHRGGCGSSLRLQLDLMDSMFLKSKCWRNSRDNVCSKYWDYVRDCKTLGFVRLSR
jgi:hypothetical protein